MHKRFPFITTVFLMLIMIGLLAIAVPGWLLETSLPASAQYWLFPLGMFAVWLSSEFVAQHGPEPLRGPLTNIAMRIPKARDRVMLIIATILAWILFALGTTRFQRPSLAEGITLLFTAAFAFYAICLLFGTQDLRLLILRIRSNDKTQLTRPTFPHEEQPFLQVGEEMPDAKSLDFARFDFIVQELRIHDYHVVDKYWVDNGPLTFSLYWLERGIDDKLALQAETGKGIKLFGPTNLLDEVRQFLVPTK